MSERTIAVRYYTKTGNTKKLAEAIAEASGVKAQKTDILIKGKCDILFLGASVYWGGIDKDVNVFIKSLDKNKIGKVVVFSTSALAERAFPEIEKLLKAQGIKAEQENYYTRGQFTAMHKGKPNSDDVLAAAGFAKKILSR